MRRNLVLGAIIGLLFANASFASDEIRSHRGRVTFILHKDKEANISIVTGLNYLDPIRNVDCKSATGCIISISGIAEITSGVGSPQLCSFVDQRPSFPACASQIIQGQMNRINFLASAIVGQGTHAIQSAVSSSDSTGTIDFWMMQYTVYEIDR